MPTDIVATATTVNLTALADTIRTAHAAVGHAARNMLSHAMAAGDALIKARQQVAPGGWESWLKRECDLAIRTAQRYAQLAEARTLFEGDPSRATGLSITGALRLLGNKSRTKPIAGKSSAKSVPDLSSLAWSDASPAARTKFLEAIGLASLREALPPTWRSHVVQPVSPRSREILRQHFDIELKANAA